MRKVILAAAALAASAANAAVYHPSFDGPALDPTMTFQSYLAGSSYTVGFGTLALVRNHPSLGAIIDTSFMTPGDFDASITLDRSALGGAGAALIARTADFASETRIDTRGGTANATGYVQFDHHFPTTVDYVDTSPTMVMRLTRVGHLFSTFVDGNLLASHVDLGDADTYLFSLYIEGISADRITPLPGYQAAFFSDFSVTTPDACGIASPCVGPGVPEPASWALFIAGFGLTGAALRASGRRQMAARPA